MNFHMHFEPTSMNNDKTRQTMINTIALTCSMGQTQTYTFILFVEYMHDNKLTKLYPMTC